MTAKRGDFDIYTKLRLTPANELPKYIKASSQRLQKIKAGYHMKNVLHDDEEAVSEDDASISARSRSVTPSLTPEIQRARSEFPVRGTGASTSLGFNEQKAKRANFSEFHQSDPSGKTSLSSTFRTFKPPQPPRSSTSLGFTPTVPKEFHFHGPSPIPPTAKRKGEMPSVIERKKGGASTSLSLPLYKERSMPSSSTPSTAKRVSHNGSDSSKMLSTFAEPGSDQEQLEAGNISTTARQLSPASTALRDEMSEEKPLAMLKHQKEEKTTKRVAKKGEAALSLGITRIYRRLFGHNPTEAELSGDHIWIMRKVSDALKQQTPSLSEHFKEGMRTMSMMQYQTEKSDEYYTSGEKEREARMKSELTELFDLYDLDSLQHTSPESKRKEARRKKREMEEEEAHFQELQKQKQREEERRRRREEIRMNGGDPNELLSQKSSLTPRSPLSPMCGGSSSSSGSGGGGGGGGGGSGDSSYFPSTPSGAGAWPNALQRYPSQFTPSKTRSYKSQTARSAGATYRSKDGEAPSRNIPNVEELNQRNQNFLHDWAEEEQMRLERERRQSFLRESDVLMSFGSAQKKEKESFDILRELEEKKKVQREKTPADIVDEMLRRADGTMSPPSLSGITSASASHSPSHSASPRSFSHSSSVSPSRLNIHSSQDLSASAVLNAEGADGSSSAIPLNSSLSASSSLSQLSSTLSSSAAAAANGVVLEYADENDTSVVSIAKQTRMLIREQLHLPVHVPLMKRQHDIAIQRQREAQDMKLLEDEMKEKEKEKEGEEDRAGGTHHTEMLSQQKKEDDEEFLKKLLEEDEFAHSIAPQDRTGTDASKLRSNIPLPVLDAATSLILPPSGSPATAASHQNTQQSSLQLRQSNPASINRPMAHLKQAPSEASLPPARKEAQTLPESLRQTDASCVVLPSYPSASFIEPSSLEDTALLGPVTIISSHPSSPNNNRDRREKGNGASQEGEGVEGERGGNAGENGFISAHDDELDSFLSIRDD